MGKAWSVEKEIMSKQTERGGWTKKQLAKWQVPWPPPKDWKELMIRRETLSYIHAMDLEMDLQCDQTRDRDRK
jgi:hypothetical protein